MRIEREAGAMHGRVYQPVQGIQAEKTLDFEAMISVYVFKVGCCIGTVEQEDQFGGCWNHPSEIAVAWTMTGEKEMKRNGTG
jgi:hypothetical protein